MQKIIIDELFESTISRIGTCIYIFSSSSSSSF